MIVHEMKQETQASGPRRSLEFFCVERIAEQLARCVGGNSALVFSFDVPPAERVRLRQIARIALDAAKEGAE